MKARKNYLIDKEFQLSFIFRNAAYIIISSLFIFIMVISYNTYKFRQNYLMLTPTSERLQEWAVKNNVSPNSVSYACQFIIQSREITFIKFITKPLLTAVLINAFISLLTSLYFSHRIAGPLYHMKRVLKSKIEGKDTGPIHIRKNDYFFELAEMINKALDLKEKEPKA